ncbi:MAG TPA: tRNA preQ1(34) S-adenosylmethionine ribosyltransferase-isomerase QueA [Alphaproteobacteria bacterium]|nr:tRNA preQ1(34) S-adenosylmethionine ribosyltransferase-isomerase QueA [Alphaproteobacteria bacterium]
MKLSDFDFDLPADLIAQRPVEPRDAARLLEVGERLADHAIRDLPRLLRAGDILVYNDTRVIKARLNGRRGTVAVEATLHQRVDDTIWRAFARPGKRLRTGDLIEFAPGFAAEVREKSEGGEVTLAFLLKSGTLLDALNAHGRMPLPPYIKRGIGGEKRDEADYQTVWGVREGAVAASTAGLHFTPDLLAGLDAAGIRRVPVTLHVGAGTFLPVKTETVEEHRMHAEWGELSADTAQQLEAARKAGGRIVAVGTTALRVLETVARELGRLAPWQGETRLFVLPGFRFKAVDLLLTNFHLPKSTLFMLVAAFAGLERMKAAYAHAIRERYRFFSYGDACLLHPAPP